MEHPDDTKRHIEVAKEYFRRGDAKRADIVDLFTDDVEFHFPKFGIKRGKNARFEIIAGFAGELAWIRHDFEKYNYIAAGRQLAVEGTTEGAMLNGKTWSGGRTPGGRFCSIFEFRDGLICRLYLYLDPDYTAEDEARFRWSRDGREW